MSDAGAGGLALNDVMLRLTNDGTAIIAALGLCCERLCRVPEYLCGDRLRLCERVDTQCVNGTSSVGRYLFCVNIDSAATWFVAGGVLGGLAHLSCMLVRIVGGFQNRRIGGAQIGVRLLLADSLTVVVNLLGFLFQHRGR